MPPLSYCCELLHNLRNCCVLLVEVNFITNRRSIVSHSRHQHFISKNIFQEVGDFYMYFLFLDELRKFTIRDFSKQTHLGYTLITLFLSYTLLSIHTSPICFCAGCTSSGHWLKKQCQSVDR